MKITEKIKQQFRKQKYGLVGEHSAVQICQWTKNSLNKNGVCWKEKFYGIKSHRCCQMSPAFYNCENKCLHCWRNTDYTSPNEVQNPDDPDKIIEGVINARIKLLNGFGGNKKVSRKRLQEAFHPTLFTFSLSGEATLYPRLDELIQKVRNRGAVSFLVTNGLNPEVIKKLEEKNSLPTQMTVSMNVSNEKFYKIWHRSCKKDAWKKFNETLDLMKKLKGKVRRAIRLNLVKSEEGDNFINKLSNMEDGHIKEYAELIKKAEPDFIHVDGFKSIGYARNRMSHKKMPNYAEIKRFAKKLAELLKPKGYRIMGEEKRSCVVLISNVKDKKNLLIKNV